MQVETPEDLTATLDVVWLNENERKEISATPTPQIFPWSASFFLCCQDVSSSPPMLRYHHTDRTATHPRISSFKPDPDLHPEILRIRRRRLTTPRHRRNPQQIPRQPPHQTHIRRPRPAPPLLHHAHPDCTDHHEPRALPSRVPRAPTLPHQPPLDPARRRHPPQRLCCVPVHAREVPRADRGAHLVKVGSVLRALRVRLDAWHARVVAEHVSVRVGQLVDDGRGFVGGEGVVQG